MTEADVLVVGAGPTGLVTALTAHDHGARVRVVERRPEAFRPSRAMVVHPRTLEVLRPYGVVDTLLAAGNASPTAELHLGGRRVTARLADVMLPDTPYPHLTLLRQADVEAVLAGALAERGVEVERGAELVDVAREGDRVVGLLRRQGRTRRAPCRFVAGCDGASSTVRRLAGVGWPGAAYREEVVLADVELTGDLAPDRLHVSAGRPGLVFCMSPGELGTWRLMATRPDAGGGLPYGVPSAEVAPEEVQRLLDDAAFPATVRELRWSARVRLQHRVASAFRHDRLFLAGDAAHSHSPAGAQGMNTGIQDAVNLGWKLAYAAASGAPDGLRDTEALLGSYDLERRPVARQVLALTHLIFWAEASPHPVPAFLRGAVVPRAAPALPLLLGRPLLVAQVVRLLSQRWVRYHRSPLSVQGTPGGPGPHPGDRLPDRPVTVGGRHTRLHDVTATPGIHVLLGRRADPPVLRSSRVTTHRVDSWSGDGLLGVRPDGYVGFRTGRADSALLQSWLRRMGAAT